MNLKMERIWMRKTSLRVKSFKELTINTGSINDFISYMAVYYLGAGEMVLGALLFLIYVILGNVQYRFWYRSMGL